jgi:hypothetical protein
MAARIVVKTFCETQTSWQHESRQLRHFTPTDREVIGSSVFSSSLTVLCLFSYCPPHIYQSLWPWDIKL